MWGKLQAKLFYEALELEAHETLTKSFTQNSPEGPVVRGQ